jgi:hypothetical protein
MAGIFRPWETELMAADDDLDAPLWGARAIAQEIGRSLPATFNLLEQGLLPARRIGHHWCTTRRRLREFFNNESTEAA